MEAAREGHEEVVQLLVEHGTTLLHVHVHVYTWLYAYMDVT